MKKLSIILSVLIISTVFVSAETAELTESDFEKMHDSLDLTELQQSINSNQDEIPGFAASIIGDHRINIYFQETDQTYSAVMNGTEVESLERSEVDEHTLEIYINEESLEALISSEQPFSELKEQLDKGGIEYEAVSRTDTVKMLITETVIDLVSRFSVF